MSEYKQLSEKLAVRSYVEPGEVAGIAAAGFKGIINNRPDDEELGQPNSSELQAEAERHGLAYWHIPVVPGHATPADVEAFAEALRQSEGPVIAFCRTGARSTKLWETAQRHL